MFLTAADNMWLWTATKSGSFSLSAWNVARDSHPVFVFAPLVWWNLSSPKTACCLLRALQDRLLTRSRLQRFCIIQHDVCVLCNANSETIMHLFFQCPFSSYVWSLCKLKLSMTRTIAGSLQDEASNFLNAFSTKKKVSVLGKITLAAAVWHTWSERNKRIFQHEASIKFEVTGSRRLQDFYAAL